MARVTDPALALNLDALIARRGFGLSEFAIEAGVARNTLLRFRQGRGISPGSLRLLRDALERLPELGAVPVVEVAS